MRAPYIPHVFGEEVREKLQSRRGWFCAAVASSVPWPKKDVWIQYGGDDFILRGTENEAEPTAPSISVPKGTLSAEEILAKVYRLSSVLGWFLGGYVDVVSHIHGSHPMTFGAQMRQAFSTVGQFGNKAFNCNHMPIIEDESVRIALAFWREGERLTRVHDSYAFLSYFKVIESQFKNSNARVAWFNHNIDQVGGDAADRVTELRASGADVGVHLYDSGRCAVAHASLGRDIVDPDIPGDRQRIALDLVLMRELARRFIALDLEVPTAQSTYTSRDRLTPWDSLIASEALETLRAGGTPDVPLGIDRQQVTVRLWPDGPITGLETMDMHVDVVHDGQVRVVLFNPNMTLMLLFILDYRNGRVHNLLDHGSLLKNDRHPICENDVRAFATVFHSVIGNAVVELCIDGLEPVECEVVIPVNIIPRIPSEAVEEAIDAFRLQQGSSTE